MNSSLLIFVVFYYFAAATHYASAKPPPQGDDASLSASFALGQSVGERAKALDAPSKTTALKKAPKATFAEDCRQQIADRVYGKLRAVGFLVEKPLLAQIADRDLREKMCRIYEAESQTLCLLPERGAPHAHRSTRRTPPLLGVVRAVCDAHNTTLRRHADCLADVSAKLETQCAFACRQQFRGAAPLNAQTRDANGAPTAAAAADALCRLATCAVRCVSAQLNECEHEADELPLDGDEGGALQALYERANALQMLMGVASASTSSAPSDANEARVILKSGKIPRKCQLFVQKFDDGDDDDNAER